MKTIQNSNPEKSGRRRRVHNGARPRRLSMSREDDVRVFRHAHLRALFRKPRPRPYPVPVIARRKRNCGCVRVCVCFFFSLHSHSHRTFMNVSIPATTPATRPESAVSAHFCPVRSVVLLKRDIITTRTGTVSSHPLYLFDREEQLIYQQCQAPTTGNRTPRTLML